VDELQGKSPSSSSLGEVEARLRLRSLMPQTLDYDPFENPANTKRLLLDLVTWVLAGKIHHRLAGTIRNLIGMWVKVDEYEKLPELQKRIEALESQKQIDRGQ
jgi:hypothetical protein